MALDRIINTLKEMLIVRIVLKYDQRDHGNNFSLAITIVITINTKIMPSLQNITNNITNYNTNGNST